MTYILLRLKRFCGFITGIVFFTGGILKLMDPVGAGLVMGEYLDFLHIGFLGFASKFLGVVFALAETVIGTALITGVWRKTFGIAAMSFQAFFTFLTLLLVIFNPPMDCGCFGEAIHLTHIQTFLKNIILCALLAAYFFPQKMLGHNLRRKYVSFGTVTLSVIGFCIYSLMYIPLVDFTDYKPGITINSSGIISEDEFESVFVYEKEGMQEKFTLDNLPDSTWTFVSTETISTAGPEATTLSFYNQDGEYMDQLATEGKVIVISVYNHDLSQKKVKRIAEFISEASESGYRVLILTSSPEGSIHGLESVPYVSDYKTLLSLNRSNAGATYFHDGHLIHKWSWRSLPDKEKLESLSQEDKTEVLIGHNTKGSLGFQGFLLYVFAVMLLL